jgi:hypothetical protein
MLHSTKKPSFINWLDETAKTAKPLCVGSIPTRASKFFNNLALKGAFRCFGTVAEIIANAEFFDRLRYPVPTESPVSSAVLSASHERASAH